jgi:hypothetical protein
MIKYHAFTLWACLLPMIVSSSAQKVESAPRTVTQVFDRSVTGPERACIALANAMPEDRYGFVPMNGEFKGVRSFAQLVKHIAADNYLNGAALLREKPPADLGVHENGPDSLQTKAQVLRFLGDSFAYLHRAVATVNEKNLMEAVDYSGGGRVTRLGVVASAIAHPWDIYGQMIEYLRMNGIDPQAGHGSGHTCGSFFRRSPRSKNNFLPVLVEPQRLKMAHQTE